MMKTAHPKLVGKYLYFGNLPKSERQYESKRFVGLALTPTHDREISHDAREALPVLDNSVEKIQSQDVFEHLDYDCLSVVLDDVYRALAPSGIFRLSLPDYNSPFVLTRCVFNEHGEVIADLRMGASVKYDSKSKRRMVEFSTDGGAHLWFPTYEKVKALVARSSISKCSSITYHHYFIDKEDYFVQPFPENEMWVKRAPPHDNRAGGLPLSLVVDFTK